MVDTILAPAPASGGGSSASPSAIAAALMPAAGGGAPGALVFNAKTFGAQGDSNGTSGNGTDDLAGINAAIAAASLSGGVIWFPPGCYRIAAPRIRINASNVTLDGPGAWLFFDTTDVLQYGSVLIDGYMTSGGTLTQGFISNVHVHNLRISRLAGPNVGTAGTNDPIGGDQHGSQSCIITMRGCKNFSIWRCETFNSPSWTINIYDCHNGDVSNNWVHDNLYDGIHAQAGSTDIRIFSNRVERCGDDGIAVAGASNLSAENDNIQIYDNDVTNIGGSAYAIYGPTGTVVIHDGSATNPYFNLLKVVAAGVSGTVSGGTAATFGSSAIKDVTMRGTKGRMIGVPGSQSTVGNGTQCGVYIDSYGGTVGSVTVAGVAMTGVRNNYVYCSSTGVAELLIDGGRFSTISVVTGDAAGAGISLSGISTVTIQNVKIIGSQVNAIDVGSNVSIARISNNTISLPNGLTAGNALNIGAGTAYVSGNFVTGVPSNSAFKAISNPALDANNIASLPAGPTGGGGGGGGGGANLVASPNDLTQGSWNQVPIGSGTVSAPTYSSSAGESTCSVSRPSLSDYALYQTSSVGATANTYVFSAQVKAATSGDVGKRIAIASSQSDANNICTGIVLTSSYQTVTQTRAVSGSTANILIGLLNSTLSGNTGDSQVGTVSFVVKDVEVHT